MAIKNKTAISLMLSYVLLVVMAIALSVGVYSWLKFYATGTEPIEKCPEDVSLIIQDYKLLADKQIELSIKNKGLFNISGYYIKGADNKTQESWFSLKDIMGVGISGAVEGTYLFSAPFPPNAESTNTFSYEGLEKLEKIEIEPFRIQEKTLTKKNNIILCDSAIITQEIIEYGCDSYHLSNCKDATNCTDAGGHWCGYTCRSTRCPFNPIFLESLVSWWKFDEADGSLVFDFKDGNNGKIYGNTRLLMHFDEGAGNPKDNSSYGNNGVITGATWLTSGCQSGSCLSFNGASDIDVGNSATIQPSTAITLSAWAKFDNPTSDWDILVSSQHDGAINGYSLMKRGDSPPDVMHFQVGNGAWHGCNGISTFSAGTWYLLTGTYDGSTSKCYVNGNLEGSTNSPGGITYSYNTFIGKQPGTGGPRYMNGQIDEVAIYSKALTLAEIIEINNSGRAKFIERVPGKSENALQFDGVDDYVEANVAGIKITTVFWYKNSTAASWTFVANSSGTLYVNGALGTPNQYPIYTNGNTVQIGKTGSSSFFNGSIDEVMVFNEALSQENITSIYQYYTG